jgi:hypothetical protein
MVSMSEAVASPPHHGEESGSAPSFRCWRVFVKDRRGHTWAPIFAAVDEAEVRERAAVVYPESTFLEAEPIQVAMHGPFGRDQSVETP